MCQAVLRKRLNEARTRCATVMYDLSNAFANSRKQDLYELLDQTNTLSAHHLRQRVERANMTLECSDNALSLKIGSGVLPGDTGAGQWFIHDYHKMIDRFTGQTPQLTIPSLCEFMPSLIAGDEELRTTLGHEMSTTWDVSKTTYADDFARTFKARDIDELRGKANASSEVLENA